jgi:hypothetical protein
MSLTSPFQIISSNGIFITLLESSLGLTIKPSQIVLDAASLVKDPTLSSLENGIKKLAAFKELVGKMETQRESLVNLQSQFRNKLETVKYLRDGVCILIFHYL